MSNLKWFDNNVQLRYVTYTQDVKLVLTRNSNSDTFNMALQINDYDANLHHTTLELGISDTTNLETTKIEITKNLEENIQKLYTLNNYTSLV